MAMDDRERPEYPVSFDECLRQLETLHEFKYALPGDVESKLRDIIDQAQTARDREQTAERCGELITYLTDQHPDYAHKAQLRRYLNGVMTDLYGNRKD